MASGGGAAGGSAAGGGAAAVPGGEGRSIASYEQLFANKTTKVQIDASLNGYKAARTRVRNEGERILPTLQANPSDNLVRDMQLVCDKILHYRAVLEAAYMRLQEIDAAHFNVYEAAINKLYEETSTDLDTAYAALQTARDALSAPAHVPVAAGAAGGGAARVRPDETLKPQSLLSLSYNPDEMRTWMVTFMAYYDSSRFDTCSVPVQQAYLLNCLDATLATRLREGMGHDTPIKRVRANPGLVTCEGLIEQEFLRKYPVFVRRLRFFNYRQSSGQLFSDYAAKLRKIGDEAELARIGVDELYVYRWLTGCTDEKLLGKMLEKGTCNQNDLRDVYRIYEQAIGAQQALAPGGGAQNHNSRIDSGGAPGNGGGGRGRSKSRGRDDGGGPRCWRCDKTKHGPEECPHKNATCYYCGIKGHVKLACMKKRRDDNRDARRDDGQGGSGGRGGRGSSPRRSPSRRRSRSPMGSV